MTGLRTTTTSRCEDQTGRRLAKARLAEGLAGVAQLHDLIGQQLGQEEADQVAIGIETDRGPWVTAVIAAGYRVVTDQPAAGGALPGAAQRVRGQE